MRPYYVTWRADDGWYCADLHSSGDGRSIGEAWENADYIGPCETATEALLLTNPHAEQTVKVDAEDRVELFHMLRGRGGSALKDKLMDALRALDPARADMVERYGA